MNKQQRLTKLTDWYMKTKVICRQVFEYMLTHKFITENVYNKEFSHLSSANLGVHISRLRLLGANITGTKYKNGGATHYTLRDKSHLLKICGLEVLKKTGAQPLLYSKATKTTFELAPTNQLDYDFIEQPVYYWEDDRGVKSLDRELMCKEFNEKLDNLQYGIDEAQREKQQDYAMDNMQDEDSKNVE